MKKRQTSEKMKRRMRVIDSSSLPLHSPVGRGIGQRGMSATPFLRNDPKITLKGLGVRFFSAFNPKQDWCHPSVPYEAAFGRISGEWRSRHAALSIILGVSLFDVAFGLWLGTPPNPKGKRVLRQSRGQDHTLDTPRLRQSGGTTFRVRQTVQRRFP